VDHEDASVSTSDGSDCFLSVVSAGRSPDAETADEFASCCSYASEGAPVDSNCSNDNNKHSGCALAMWPSNNLQLQFLGIKEHSPCA